MAIAFRMWRGLLYIRRRRNCFDDGYYSENEIMEFHALTEII